MAIRAESNGGVSFLEEAHEEENAWFVPASLMILCLCASYARPLAVRGMASLHRHEKLAPLNSATH